MLYLEPLLPILLYFFSKQVTFETLKVPTHQIRSAYSIQPYHFLIWCDGTFNKEFSFYLIKLSSMFHLVSFQVYFFEFPNPGKFAHIKTIQQILLNFWSGLTLFCELRRMKHWKFTYKKIRPMPYVFY